MHPNLKHFLHFQHKWKQIKMGKQLAITAAWNIWTFLSRPDEAEIIQHAKALLILIMKKLKAL